MKIEKINVEAIASILPFFTKNKMIYESSRSIFELYDRKQKEMIWSVRVESNLKTEVFANKLAGDIFAIGSSL